MRGPPVMMRLLIVAAALADGALDAQEPNDARRAGGVVTGVVRDSMAHAPIAGAWVQIVPANRPASVAHNARSDSLGRFAFDGLDEGRYLIGFFHPVLDSLGVEPTVRQVNVRKRRATRVALASPSAVTLRRVICSAPSVPATGGAVMGVVRDARTRAPLAGVEVTGEWLEVSLVRGGGVTHHRRRLTVTSLANGWFVLCNVPARGTLYVQASRGADSTDVVDAVVPDDGFVRRELYIGPSRVIALADSEPALDSTLVRRTRRVGDGLLRGTIVSGLGGRPLAGAVLRLGGNPPIRTDEQGRFTVTEAPHGTRMLEARAVGHSQQRRAVDVVADSVSVVVTLASAKAMLDTVRVVVARVADRQMSGFEVRRRSGAGTYLTAEQIARRGVFSTSDLFRQLRGMKVGFDYDTLETDAAPFAGQDVAGMSDRRLLMRGISGNWCEPALWFDGMLIPELSVDAIDAWVTPERLFAIEVYSEATVPPNYQRQRSGCGAVLFWRK
ncbi:MAG: carboxypeptidase regulatory-like domain-containing protein [Gemmatimonadaceae bacterium]|nr:carboxypeptidase regulatory-like domain-containing protein [Gemmatimonadaceae bacterium]